MRTLTPRLLLGSTLGALALAAVITGAPTATVRAAAEPGHGPGSADSLMVKYVDDRPGRDARPITPGRLAKLRKVARAYGVALDFERTMGLGAQVLNLDRTLPARRLAELGRAFQAADPAIRWVEPDVAVEPQSAVWIDDPYFASGHQWNLQDGPGGIRAQEAWDEDWQLVAVEDRVGFTPGASKRLVRYGAYGKNWDYRVLSGGFGCDNGEFVDRAAGTKKRCEVARYWSWLTNEGDANTFDLGVRSRWVRFGWGEDWAFALTSGVKTCTKAGLGVDDPAPGVPKICQVQERPPGEGVVAVEKGPGPRAFTTTGWTTLRYGAINRWVHRSVPPNTTVACSNAQFGDPSPGEDKHCGVLKSVGAGVVVGVIDRGRAAHPDLSGKYDRGLSVRNGVYSRTDLDPGEASWSCEAQPWTVWHGLLVAGVIAAETHNGAYLAGVAAGTRILPVEAVGCAHSTIADAMDGILWAAGYPVGTVGPPDNPVRVINTSWRASGNYDDCSSSAWAELVGKVRAKNIVWVAAAGNGGENLDQVSYLPGACEGVVLVAGSNFPGHRWEHSAHSGPVALAAPGQDVMVLDDQGVRQPATQPSLNQVDGTSYAAAHVSGVAALMIGKNPALSADNVAARLRLSARGFPAESTCLKKCGSGILDAARALESAEAITAESSAVNDFDISAELITAPADVSGTIKASTRGCIAKTCPLYADLDVFAVDLPPGAELRLTLQPGSDCGTCRMRLSTWPDDGYVVGDQSAVYLNRGLTTKRMYIRIDSPSDISKIGSYTLLASWDNPSQQQ